MKKYNLEVKKVKRSWCVVAGKSVLGKYRTEEVANRQLEYNRDFFEYWAESAGVMVENTDPVVVNIKA